MKTSYFFKKSVASVLFCVFALSFQMKAQQATIDGIIYKVVAVEGSDNYAETSALPKNGDLHTPYTQESITIPATVTIDGAEYAVKRIGDNSMRENPNLKSISLPDGLEIIGKNAFEQCPLIEEVVVPSSVKSIDDWAFNRCTNLAKINIPDGITAITEHTFQQTGLTGIVLPASVKSLGTCAFQTATKLTSINLENITEIKSWALGETGLTSVVIKNVEYLGGAAFYTCPNLESVVLESAVQTGEWTFQNCTKLKEVTLPNTLESIDMGAFSGCSSLQSITIPNSVQFLGAWVFQETGITEIFASWENPDNLISDENIFGANEGKINFTWKVPENLRGVYGNEFLGYPIESYSVGNALIQTEANVYYSSGSLIATNLDGYKAAVYSLDGRQVSGFNINGSNYNAPLSLASGIYIFKAADGSKIATAKFAVK